MSMYLQCHVFSFNLCYLLRFIAISCDDMERFHLPLSKKYEHICKENLQNFLESLDAAVTKKLRKFQY